MDPFYEEHKNNTDIEIGNKKFRKILILGGEKPPEIKLLCPLLLIYAKNLSNCPN
jgi:hypothetical protein